MHNKNGSIALVMGVFVFIITVSLTITASLLLKLKTSDDDIKKDNAIFELETMAYNKLNEKINNETSPSDDIIIENNKYKLTFNYDEKYKLTKWVIEKK